MEYAIITYIMPAVIKETDRRSPFHNPSEPTKLGITANTIARLTGEPPESFKTKPHGMVVWGLASAVNMTGEVRFNPVGYSFHGHRQPPPTCIVATNGRGEQVAVLDDFDPVTTFLVDCFLSTTDGTADPVADLKSGRPVSVKISSEKTA